MVQQNLVSYIISQMRQGKKLEEINQFLLKAGYDAAEVESSVQYVINTQTNPQVAEQQRIAQLSAYIQKQITAGYDQRTIANFLISRGYPYYEVNSALQQATMPKKEMKVEHKLFLFAIISMLIVTGAMTFFFFKAYVHIGTGMPEQLLDVETEKLTTLVQPGGELTFQVNLMSFGSGQRYDVLLNYKVIDRETEEVILEEMETVALSTTVEKLEKFEIPSDIKPGKYLLRVDATYEDFTATSGFVFDIIPIEQAEEIREEVEEMLPEENETEEVVIPEIPVVPEIPEVEEEAVPTPITPPKAGEEWYKGKTRQQAFEYIKAVSVREPQRAVEMCKELRVSQHQRECIINIAKFKKDGTYCKFLEGQDQDLCYFQLVMEEKQYQVCDQITKPELKRNCELMKQVDDAQKNAATGTPEPFTGFSMNITPVTPPALELPQFG